MSHNREPIKRSESSLIGTRELITVPETAYKKGHTERDQETFDMVRLQDAANPKFHWSASYKNGKVRVTTTPRV